MQEVEACGSHSAKKSLSRGTSRSLGQQTPYDREAQHWLSLCSCSAEVLSDVARPSTEDKGPADEPRTTVAHPGQTTHDQHYRTRPQHDAPSDRRRAPAARGRCTKITTAHGCSPRKPDGPAAFLRARVSANPGRRIRAFRRSHARQRVPVDGSARQRSRVATAARDRPGLTRGHVQSVWAKRWRGAESAVPRHGRRQGRFAAEHCERRTYHIARSGSTTASACMQTSECTSSAGRPARRTRLADGRLRASGARCAMLGGRPRLCVECRVVERVGERVRRSDERELRRRPNVRTRPERRCRRGVHTTCE